LVFFPLHTSFIFIFFWLSSSFHVVAGLIEMHFCSNLFAVRDYRHDGCCGAIAEEVNFFCLQL